ncbi:MAG TPA: hypothetical protein VGA05_08375 [Candidatus Bathyarchaeia archaeon]
MPEEMTNGTQTTSGTGTETSGSEQGQKTDQSALSAALGDGTKTEDQLNADKAKAPVVPEKYADFTAPEGLTLDPKAIEEAAPIFKELGLSQEGAQKLVDFYGKQVAKLSSDSISSWTKTREDWREELKSDPTLGKELAPDGKVPVTVNRALDGLQNPKLVADFKDAMNTTGAGDNPAFVRVLYALASKLTEGTSYAQGGPTGAKNASRSAAAAVYPNLPSNSGDS